MNISFPPPHPRGEWAGGAGKARWVDNSREVRAYPSLSPFPSRFLLHTYSQPPTGDRRRLVFSERRELALSVVSCLLPSSSSPSLLLAPTTPRYPPPPPPQQLGNLQQNTAVMRFPWTRAVAWVCPALPCPALPCPVSTWGTGLWKERLLGLPIEERRRGDSLPPPSLFLSPPWHQIASCGGPAWLPFWPGLWATPMSGHLSGEG